MVVPSSDLDVAGHLALAREQIAYADWLATSGRADPVTVGWAITAVYYAALHAASGYVLARHGDRVATHADRDRWFRPGGFPEFSRVDRTDYLDLKRQSEAARYHGQIFGWPDFAKLRARAAQFVAKFSGRTASRS